MAGWATEGNCNAKLPGFRFAQPRLRSLNRNVRFKGNCPCPQLNVRFGAVLICVAYSVNPVNASPPTRFPSTVGISFQIR